MLTDYDCGPTCLVAMYLWADEIPTQTLMSLVDTSGLIGGVETMKAELEKLGKVSFDWTCRFLPLVCLIWADDCEHWVILTHVSSSSAWYMDPIDGEIHCTPLPEWDRVWNHPELSSPLVGLYCEPHRTLQEDHGN